MIPQLTPAEHIRLWNDFRDGSQNAFSQLYERFSADLYRYGYNLIRNRQLVEDCLHELFLHLHENRARLAPLTTSGSTSTGRYVVGCWIR
ncbi:hypothetical protein [Spirosoma telluris]|uniref:RNA polymerase sigma factor n=1 Tax=Spirosoma telluris TaxID=2183553 RepID=UPI002FC2ACF1